MKYTTKQLENIEKFSRFISIIIPQFNNPMWLIRFLSNILPDYCVFERSLFVGNTLVLYIPKLCNLNPYFNAIIEYRLSTYN